MEGDNPIVCANFYPSNPPAKMDYASQLMAVLLENVKLNRGADDAARLMEKLNKNSPGMQAEFKPDEFLKVCEKISGLASIQALCDLVKLPERIKLQILECHVTKMFGSGGNA